MEIRDSHAETVRGAEHFTGDAWINHLVKPGGATSLGMQSVYFTPGARTHWHHHPEGQIIHVVAGVGRIQERGGPVRTIRAGDTVITPPGEWHWHGASPDSAMTMIAVQGADGNGEVVLWGEPLSDRDYRA